MAKSGRSIVLLLVDYIYHLLARSLVFLSLGFLRLHPDAVISPPPHHHKTKIITKRCRPSELLLLPAVRSPPSVSRLPPQDRLTLVLDLDETLVHSSSTPIAKSDIQFDLVLDGSPCRFFVAKRPHLDSFLYNASRWCDLILFTASMQKYADRVIDQLDVGCFIQRRYYRESCISTNEGFMKDLSIIGSNLS